MKTYVRSGENAFVPQNQRINLALGTVASSDCSEIDAGPEYAVDGDFSTWWESDAGCDESHHWLCVDFGEPVRLSEVWIRWKSVARPYVIEARRSETDEWTELARYTAAFRKEERVRQISRRDIYSSAWKAAGNALFTSWAHMNEFYHRL